MGKVRDLFGVRIWIISKSDGKCGMVDIILRTSEIVTLVGGGEASKDLLDAALAIAPYLVAADGGAEMVLNYGMAPKKVIGDFDSINKAALKQIPEERQYRLSEQNSTDFDKCLRNIIAPLILGVGFLGRRLDHQLAALSSLVGYSQSPCVLLGSHDLIFHLNGVLELDLKPDSRLSLFPMLPVSGVSEGLEWPIGGVNFAPGSQVGTSNRVVQGRVRLNMAGPGMLVILPLNALDSVVKALCAR